MLKKKEEDKKKRKERAREAELKRYEELDRLKGETAQEEVVILNFLERFFTFLA